MTDSSTHLQSATLEMDRVTVRFPEQIINRLDQLVEQEVVPTRSEAIRVGIRMLIQNTTQPTADDSTNQ